MTKPIKLVPDAFGWILIQHKGVTLQGFRTEKECRQWLADTWVIRKIFNII
jgi:hypothetical protein